MYLEEQQMAINTERENVTAYIKKIYKEKAQILADERYPNIERNISAFLRDILYDKVRERWPDLEKEEETE